MTDGIRTDVLIAGAGPVGLAAANVLGRLGIEVLVAERDARLTDEPRAVSIDDEAMRLVQWLGLRDAAVGVAMPGTGTRYYGASGRQLGYARGPAPPPNGHPIKNPIDHGELCAMLRAGLERFAGVDVRHSTALRTAHQDAGGISARLRGDGGELEVRARYLLGCDGGRSTTRAQLGVQMSGTSIGQPWLIIDTINDPHEQRYAMHHGDPRRPYVIVPGRGGRCRYEFMLLAGEDRAAAESFETARALLRELRPSIAEQDIVRLRVYVFHALVASRWRAGAAFLLGDAAHMMPPFAAQGLNTGLRDVANLGWKLAAVLRGRAGEGILESYEAERRPHAEAMIRLSVRIGTVMMTTSRARARARDLAMSLAGGVPALRRVVGELRFKPAAHYDRGLAVRLPGTPGELVGEMLPQPRVLSPSGRLAPLDELLGEWFALIAVEPRGDALARLRSPLWDALGAARVELWLGDRFPPGGREHASVADFDGLLATRLAAHRGNVLLVRPDRFVLGSFAPEQEDAFARALETTLARAGAPVSGRQEVPA